MEKVKKWILIATFCLLWGAFSVFIVRYLFGLPSYISGLVTVLGVAMFSVWVNGDLNKGESALKEFEEHEERMRISKLYDESLKNKSE